MLRKNLAVFAFVFAFGVGAAAAGPTPTGCAAQRVLACEKAEKDCLRFGGAPAGCRGQYERCMIDGGCEPV